MNGEPRNGTHREPGGPGYAKSIEMDAYDKLPAHLKKVVQAVPFNVSVKDFGQNSAVLEKLAGMEEEEAAAWLSEALTHTYRSKILPQAQNNASS